MSATAPALEPPQRIWTEVLLLWAATAIWISVAYNAGFSDDATAIVKSLALIYVPVGWMLFTRRDLAHYGLRIDRPASAIALFAVVSIATLVPFWSANHFFETLVLHRHWLRLTPPAKFAAVAAGEVLAVALPEEVFYRGYLQTRLDDVLPRRWRLLGADVGWSIPITSAIFVLGHLVVRPQLWELSIFFPSLVFGWLRVRSRGLVAPVLYHALCNLGMLVLQASYR